MNSLKNYKKEIKYASLVVIVGTLLLGMYQVIQNTPYLIHEGTRIVANFLDVISPILWAFALAYLLYYPVSYIQKSMIFIYEKMTKKDIGTKGYSFTRLGSILIVIMIVIGLVMLMFQFIVPPLLGNIESLIRALPEVGQKMNVWLNELTNYVGALQIDWNTQSADMITFIKDALLSSLQVLLASISIAIGGISSFVVDFVVTIILTFYFLKDKEKIFKAINKFAVILFKAKTIGIMKQFLEDLDDIVGKFLVGTIFASTVVGIISSVLMLMIGHPFAVLVGVVAGITNVIPYVGPLIGALLAFVLGMFESLQLGVLGFALLILYQQVDGNIIQPKIVGDRVGIAPVWILMAVLVGGSYFGGVGMIISIPIAALVSVYIDRIYKKKIKI